MRIFSMQYFMRMIKFWNIMFHNWYTALYELREYETLFTPGMAYPKKLWHALKQYFCFRSFLRLAYEASSFAKTIIRIEDNIFIPHLILKGFKFNSNFPLATTYINDSPSSRSNISSSLLLYCIILLTTPTQNSKWWND